MQSATLEKYTASHDRLKATGQRLLGNIFLAAPELEKLFTQKNCFLIAYPGSIFLLVPRHNLYYDLFFQTVSAKDLSDNLFALLVSPDIPASLRASIIGREPMAGELASIFQEHGFILLKKLLRTRCKLPPEKILDAMRQYAEEYKPFLGFAQAGDEEEILEILKESFDVAADNLPELEEIRKNIESGEIAVLRQNNQILSLTYFTIQSGILLSFYDVTRKEHRGGQGYFLALASFLNDELQKRGVNVARSLGWREEAKKKLVKHAQKSNQLHDGLVIYNTFYSIKPDH